MPDDDTGIPLGQRALWGVAGISGGSNPLNGSFHASEQLIGVTWPVAGAYYSFDTVWSTHQNELDDWFKEEDRIFHLCWMPEKYITTVPFSGILAGDLDAKIDEHLAGMAAWDGRVICRFMPEMNGNWHVWSMALSSGAKFPYKGVTSIEQFIDVWQYVVDKGRIQAPNVEWLWAPNGNDVGIYTAEDYYPGDDYVDWIGFDAYNSYGDWGTPYDTWAPIYDRICALNETAPVMIGETGCKEDPAVPGRKAEWVNQMFAETRFARMKIITYFDTVGGFDWKFQTSQSSLDAFTAGFTGIINEDAIDDEWGVWPASPPPPETFVPEPLPLLPIPLGNPDQTYATIWTDPDWHRSAHGNVATYLNAVLASTGGDNLGLRGASNGNFPAIEGKAKATGTASVAIIRALTDVAEPTKYAFASRSGGASFNHWGCRMDGRQEWGTGSGSSDTHLYRNAAGQLATAALWADQTGTAPSSNPSAGALVYAENDALKVRTPTLGSFVLSRRLWTELYSSTHVINDNPKLATATAQPSAGFVHLALLFNSQKRTITNVHVDVTVAGSGLADCYAAVFDLTGVQIGVTADVSTALQSTGVRTLALTAPVANVGTQKLVVALLVNGSVMPTVRTFAAPGTWNLTGINQPFVRAGGSGLTAMPSSINVNGLSSATPTPYLCAIS